MGRWLAHHLAELMNEAQSTKKSVAERVEARKQAADLILRIWERRTSLPGNVYPLAKYRDVLQVLDFLRPGRNPWQRLSGSVHQVLAARMFGSLSRLVIGLLLIDLPMAGNNKKSNQKVSQKFLSSEEQAVLRELESWLRVVRVKEKNDGGRLGSGEITVRDLLRRSADDVMKNVHELRELLQMDDAASKAYDVNRSAVQLTDDELNACVACIKAG
jgi:hypothetical protein